MKKICLIIFSFICSFSETQAQINQDLIQKYDSAMAKKDYQQGFQYVLELYNTSFSFESAVVLAGHFIGGIGTDVDFNTAAELYKGVANATEYDRNNTIANLYVGFASRQYALMLTNIKGSYDKEAFKYLMKADSVSNDAFSQFIIGLLYIDEYNELAASDVLIRSKDMAKAFFKKSAEKNCIGALTELGIIYDSEGEKDAAFNCWQKAANTPLYNPEEYTRSDPFSRLVNPNYITEPLTVHEQNEAFYRLAVAFSDIENDSRATFWADKITITNDPRYLDIKASLYAVNGEKQKAIDTYLREYELSKDTKVLGRLAIAHYTIWHDEAEAMRIFERMRELGDTSVDNAIKVLTQDKQNNGK